jgi:hypothetical protein
MTKVTNAKAKAGRARAESLSPDRRAEIARAAAEARWDPTIAKATHTGALTLGDAEIECHVLADGSRVLSTRGVMKSLGRRWRGRKYPGTELPVFLEANNLRPFISNDLAAVLSPVAFRPLAGMKAEGFRAEALPAVCDIYLQARDAGVLTGPQLAIAKQCEILVRALSKVGIIALVDEATGYQEVRDRRALQEILDKFLRKELAAWAKRFPDEFYQQIFRLRGWQWKGMRVNRPQVVAKYTKDFVYERLAPGILEELEGRNPPDAKGRRKTAHHQWLTDDVGHPALAQHLFAVIALMRAAPNWDVFLQLLNRSLPRRGRTLELLPIDD